MMRRLVERHAGILPLDTAESIWRVIIATFTYVQAPFRVHADFSAGESAMRDCERFHFGFTVPLVGHMAAPPAWWRRSRRRRPISAWCRSVRAPRRRGGGRRLVGRARRRRRAEDHRPAAVRRARASSGRPAGLRHRPAASRRHRQGRGDMERPRRRMGRAPGAGAGGPRRSGGGAGPRLRWRRAAGAGARGQHARRNHRRAGRRPAPRCAAGLSSAAMHGAIRSAPMPGVRRACVRRPDGRQSGRMPMSRDQSVRLRGPASWRSMPTCPARAARPASPRSTSCPRTRRRSGRARARSRPINGAAGHLQDYPDGAADRLARGDRPRLRPRSCAHRLRRRIGRSPEPAGARLSRRRRRSDPHRPWLPGLPDRNARHRRQARRGGRNQLHRRCRCHSGAGDAAHPDRLPCQSQQSDRHLSAVR